jgi:predicted TIM-barrel enzyme
VQAILEATPGEPGNVTFTSNDLLNLEQQLIAALLNLDGHVAAAPTSVRTAIATAQAGITITVNAAGKISITTTLSQDQISALIDTLSTFNEGSFAGFPHCSD